MVIIIIVILIVISIGIYFLKCEMEDRSYDRKMEEQKEMENKLNTRRVNYSVKIQNAKLLRKVVEIKFIKNDIINNQLQYKIINHSNLGKIKFIKAEISFETTLGDRINISNGNIARRKGQFYVDELNNHRILYEAISESELINEGQHKIISWGCIPSLSRYKNNLKISYDILEIEFTNGINLTNNLNTWFRSNDELIKLQNENQLIEKSILRNNE